MRYFTVMTASHYLTVVFILQLAPDVLVLFPRTVPLALTIVAPLIVWRSRSFHSMLARRLCVRWLIQYVAMEAEAPTSEPTAPAKAAINVESTIRRLFAQGDQSADRGPHRHEHAPTLRSPAALENQLPGAQSDV